MPVHELYKKVAINLNTSCFNLLLADDDADDRMFFAEALSELPVDTRLKAVNDGQQLMDLLLNNPDELPDILFLDLNMPRKTGYQCLSEIRSHDTLKGIPVIVFSTSLNVETVNALFQKGANHYIRKPGDFSRLKMVILEALTIVTQTNPHQRSKEAFIIGA